MSEGGLRALRACRRLTRVSAINKNEIVGNFYDVFDEVASL